MKMLALLLTITAMTLAQSPGPWTVLNPYPTGNTLYIGSAPSENKYAVVSAQGELFMTTDGGVNWTQQVLPGDGIYRSLYFLDNNLGWAAGALNGKFSRTTDGGLTWIPITIGPDTTKYDIHFISATTGWSVGFNGFIIKTTDGGTSWFSQTNTSVTNKTLYGVFATDANTIYVSGNSDAFIKSTDGGTTWAQMPLPALGNTTEFRGIYFPPTGTGLTGFVVGHRTRILKTTDGGASWNAVLNAGGTTQLWSIHFNSQGVGLASGASGLVYRSTDMGSTWSQVSGLNTSVIYYNVRFSSDNVAYLAGGSGYMYKSTDAGATWQPLNRRFTSSRLKDIAFHTDHLTGWVVGASGYVAKSTDGGFSFTPLTSGSSLELNEVSVPSANHAYIAAYESKVVRTTDGGATFTELLTGLPSTTQLLAIDFVTPLTGYTAGTNGAVAKTTDGGNTWTNVSIPASTSLLWDMDFVDEDFGWIAGTGEKIYATTNGGQTWTEQLSNGGLGTYGISFANKFTGVAGGTGGNTFYTTNGGLNWFPAETPPGQTVWGIHIVESPTGTFAMAACASGYAYISTDGGKVWAPEPRYTISTFDDVWMTDAAHAWISGNSGIVMGYYEPSNVPVELTSFTGSATGFDITLQWTTATEQNSKEFRVERSFNKSGWTSAATLAGSGTTAEPRSYIYTDKNLAPGSYRYRLIQTDYNGEEKIYPLDQEYEIGVTSYSLEQNYPNPFNPATTITYSIPFSGHVTVAVYDITGKKIRDLVNKATEAGRHTIEFSGEELSSGIYFVRMTAGEYSSIIKMTMLK